jgi:hypothetical protein
MPARCRHPLRRAFDVAISGPLDQSAFQLCTGVCLLGEIRDDGPAANHHSGLETVARRLQPAYEERDPGSNQSLPKPRPEGHARHLLRDGTYPLAQDSLSMGGSRQSADVAARDAVDAGTRPA